MDLSHYQDIMLENLQKGRKLFDRTCICEKQDGTYFYWKDLNVFRDLTTDSVECLIKNVKVMT